MCGTVQLVPPDPEKSGVGENIAVEKLKGKKQYVHVIVVEYNIFGTGVRSSG